MASDLQGALDGTDGPVILFGAFDRHNLGDILLGHAARLSLPGRALRFAGLADRDLRAHGGFRVSAIHALAREWGDRPAHVVHVGGELLTCSTWEAAVMLQTPEVAHRYIQTWDRNPEGRQAWARRELDVDGDLPYLPPRGLFAHPGRFIYCAVGGVSLLDLPAAVQRAARETLGDAYQLTVRDPVTQQALAALGVSAPVAPDPVSLLGPWLRGLRHNRHAATALRSLKVSPHGWVAVQFAASLADDRFLHGLAAELDGLAGVGVGVVLFCAGWAPWHDDPDVYRRLAGFCRVVKPVLFESGHIAAICGLIGESRAVVASSLHVRLVADALDVPAVSLVMGESASKLRAVLTSAPADSLCDELTGLAERLLRQ